MSDEHTCQLLKRAFGGVWASCQQDEDRWQYLRRAIARKLSRPKEPDEIELARVWNAASSRQQKKMLRAAFGGGDD